MPAPGQPTPSPPPDQVRSGRRLRRWAAVGVALNITLTLAKFAAGVLGHSYALIADAIESLTDIFASLLIWSALRYGSRPADDVHPYGYGKAESLAALAVACLLFAAALAIAIEAVREIITPHHAPAPFTLVVVIAVVLIKETMFRLTRRAARQEGSTAVAVDAWHHRADAITSAVAFLGISVALIGGPGWEPADDWAALLAAAIIFYNAGKLCRAPFNELLDAEAPEIIAPARAVALAVPGVRGIEKLRARQSGTRFYLDVHLEVDPDLPVRDGHAIAGRVRAALRTELPRVADVLIHVEPFHPAPPPAH